jgi:hypothetical protein
VSGGLAPSKMGLHVSRPLHAACLQQLQHSSLVGCLAAAWCKRAFIVPGGSGYVGHAMCLPRPPPPHAPDGFLLQHS